MALTGICRIQFAYQLTFDVDIDRRDQLEVVGLLDPVQRQIQKTSFNPTLTAP